jgi:hypothetical protein
VIAKRRRAVITGERARTSVVVVNEIGLVISSGFLSGKGRLSDRGDAMIYGKDRPCMMHYRKE